MKNLEKESIKPLEETDLKGCDYERDLMLLKKINELIKVNREP